MIAKASAADVKSAFRRLAKKLHPDANKNDPKAASRFAEINAAYEIVGEKDKRKAFDRGEIDAEGKPRFQGFEGFGAGRAHDRRGIWPGERIRDLQLRSRRLHPRRAPRPRRSARRRRFWRLRGYLARGFRRRRPPWRGRHDLRGGGFRRRGRRQCHGGADHHAAGRRERRQPAGTAAVRQGGRGQDSRRSRQRPADPASRARALAGPGRRRRSPDHRLDHAASRCSRSMATISGSICRSRCTRLCSAPRCGCRLSTAGRADHSGRDQRRPHLPPQGQGLPCQGRTRRSPRHRPHRAAAADRPGIRGADEEVARPRNPTIRARICKGFSRQTGRADPERGTRRRA